MVKVVLTGWKEEMQVLVFTKLQHTMLNLTMREALDNSNAVLEGSTLTLEIDSTIADKFIEQAMACGVECHLNAE